MVDTYRLRGPIDHLGVVDEDTTGTLLEEIKFRGLVNIRGDSADKAFEVGVKKATRLGLPTDPNTVIGKPSATRIMWLGPDEWLVVTRPGGGTRMSTALGKALKSGSTHASVTEVSDSRTCFKLSGVSARTVLAKGCSIDLHPGVFAPGQCAQTNLAHVNIVLTQTASGARGAASYEIYVLRSFATYLWKWLSDAFSEFSETP